MNHGHFILGGQDGHEVVPVSALAWSHWFEKSSEDRSRFVEQTTHTLHDGRRVQVSTVFIGLGLDELFESMVFGGELDQVQRRYSSWDEAMDGHAQLCREVFGCDGDGTH